MIALEGDHATWGNVIASMDIKDQTVLLACVRCCVHLTVTTAEAYVIAKKDGKVPSAIYQWLSVNFQAALITGDVLKVTVIVKEVGKAYIVSNLTVSTHRALVMGHVYPGSVIVRLAGKVTIAASLISKCINVFLPVPITEHTTWRQDYVYVTVTGLEWIVLKPYAVSIVVQMVYVNQVVAAVTKDGPEVYAIN